MSHLTKEKARSNGQVTSWQDFRQHRETTTKPVAGQVTTQGAHAILQDRAERNAKTLLGLWMEEGIIEPLAYPIDKLPTEPLQKLAHIIEEALMRSRRGYTEIAHDYPQHISAIVEAASALSEALATGHTPNIHKLRGELNAFHLAKSKQYLTWKLQAALDRGEDDSEIIAELATVSKQTVHGSSTFPLSLADEIEDTTEVADFVENILTTGTASVVYGSSNLGKTFLVVDLAACVATGQKFRDELEVEQGAVVYVALEGTQGIRNRIIALRKAGKLPKGSPFFICFSPVSLLEAGHAERLAETVKGAADQSSLPCRLVVLDTLSRAMAGGDENAARDMTAAVQSIDKVKQATGAHVLVVHHCGKNEAAGARGHSSLRAAVDTEIELTRPEGQSITTIRITKQRDLPIVQPMPFSLKVVELGIDRRGNPITSCIVHHEDEIMADNGKKAGRKSKYHAEELLKFLPAKNVSDWQKKASEECGIPRSSFYELKRELEMNSRTKRCPQTQAIIKA